MTERQVSFAAGELSPNLHGRTDLGEYASGARTLKNFIVTPEGVLMNRPGSQFVAWTNSNSAGRLIPFVVDSLTAYMLCFTDQRLDIYCYDFSYPRYAFSLSAVLTSSFIPTKQSPYYAGDLPMLRYSQVGQTMTLVCPGYDTRELTRDSMGDWTIAAVRHTVQDFPASWEYPAIQNGGTDWASIPRYDFLGDGGSHPTREWTYQVTAVMRGTDGKTYETAPYTVIESIAKNGGVFTRGALLDPCQIAVYGDWPMRIFLGATAGNTQTESPLATLVAWRVYRGRGGTMGYLGETAEDYFVDDGGEPNYSNPPPQEFNPFEVVENEVVTRTETPSAVTFHEGRRVFAATPERPSDVWGSAFDDFTNHDEVAVPDDSDAYAFRVTGPRREEITALVSHRALVVFTSSCERVVTGAGDNAPITPNSIVSRTVSQWGSAKEVAPVVAGDTIFFTTFKGNAIRAMTINDNGIRVDDVTRHARHLFAGGWTVIGWAFAESPFSVLWVVLSNGVLMSLTHSPEGGVLAWTRHEFGGDDVTIEDVATMPEKNGEDGVWLIVNRGGTRSVERLAYREIEAIEESIFLDSSKTYNGYDVINYGVTLSDPGGGGGLIDTVARLTFTGAAPVSVGQQIEIPDPDDGDAYRFLLTASLGGNAYDAKVLNRNVPAAMFAAYVAGDFAACCTSMTGLWHLEGQEVKALADGAVIEGLTVAGGTVALDTPCALVHVGAPYTSDFESLALAQDRTKQKVIERAFVELVAARGGSVGPDLDNLEAVRSRQVSDNYSPEGMGRVDAEVPVSGQWGKTAYVAFRQSDPVPVTVLGVTREVRNGG